MIDWKKYDPARDADEHKSHLCNSLNAEQGMIRNLSRHGSYVIIERKDLERWADYMERAQATITYLRYKLENGEQNGLQSN